LGRLSVRGQKKRQEHVDKKQKVHIKNFFPKQIDSKSVSVFTKKQKFYWTSFCFIAFPGAFQRQELGGTTKSALQTKCVEMFLQDCFSVLFYHVRGGQWGGRPCGRLKLEAEIYTFAGRLNRRTAPPGRRRPPP
jgi:hypothetical protein